MNEQEPSCIIAENMTARSFHVILIAIFLLIQVRFYSSLTRGVMKILRLGHNVAAPGALIGRSNFFESAAATGVALFGRKLRVAPATRVGIPVEVPVSKVGNPMLPLATAKRFSQDGSISR